MTKINTQQLIFSIVGELQPRNKDIVIKRFGLKKDEPQTLEAIGDEYSLTRERIRQIIEASLNTLRNIKKSKTFDSFNDLAADQLRSFGGIKVEPILVREIRKETDSSNVSDSGVVFLLELAPETIYVEETPKTYAAWTLDQKHFDNAQKIIKGIIQNLNNTKRPISTSQLAQQTSGANENALRAILELFKELAINPLDEVGFVHWPDIYPRTTGDKAHIVLRRENRPMHFTEIVECINDTRCLFHHHEKLIKKWERRVEVPTVHNELIKDKRFILVGRGIYTLRGSGYTEGTVKDVLVDILKKAKKSVSEDELIQAVKKQRMVKDSTISINLRNKKYFVSTPQGFILK